MHTSRVRLAVGSLLLAWAAGMLDAPQFVPWVLLLLGIFFIVWGIWPQTVIQGVARLPRGDFLTEKLLSFGAWLDGVTSLPFDQHVADELDRMKDAGQELLTRCPYLRAGDPNYSDLVQEWNTEAKDWMENLEEYISQHMNRAEAYMFRTIGRTRPRRLEHEMQAKLAKLRLITGRYLLRDDGTR